VAYETSLSETNTTEEVFIIAARTRGFESIEMVAVGEYLRAVPDELWQGIWLMAQPLPCELNKGLPPSKCGDDVRRMCAYRK
jgi:hypothetical protein